VLPVPKKNLAAYRRMAQKAAPRQDDGTQALPFDGKRMFWGGFKVLVDL
jgi:uncharacterized protein YbaA (DUF1428 family)